MRSTPLHPRNSAAADARETDASTLARNRAASSSVEPTTTEADTRTLRSSPSRPFARALARRSATFAAALGRSRSWMNTHSAKRPAKARPAGDVPACSRNGVRCGEGIAVKYPSRSKYSPWWVVRCTFDGSA